MPATAYKSGRRYTFYGAATSKEFAQDLKQKAHLEGWECQDSHKVFLPD